MLDIRGEPNQGRARVGLVLWVSNRTIGHGWWCLLGWLLLGNRDLTPRLHCDHGSLATIVLYKYIDSASSLIHVQCNDQTTDQTKYAQHRPWKGRCGFGLLACSSRKRWNVGGARRAGQLRSRQMVSHVAAHATPSPPQTRTPLYMSPPAPLYQVVYGQRPAIPDLESAGGGRPAGWIAEGRHEMPRPLSPPQLPARLKIPI